MWEIFKYWWSNSTNIFAVFWRWILKCNLCRVVLLPNPKTKIYDTDTVVYKDTSNVFKEYLDHLSAQAQKIKKVKKQIYSENISYICLHFLSFDKIIISCSQCIWTSNICFINPFKYFWSFNFFISEIECNLLQNYTFFFTF